MCRDHDRSLDGWFEQLVDAVGDTESVTMDQAVTGAADAYRAVVADRDRLSGQVEELTAERDQLVHELDGARTELDHVAGQPGRRRPGCRS